MQFEGNGKPRRNFENEMRMAISTPHKWLRAFKPLTEV
jgi:hypothetical protein